MIIWIDALVDIVMRKTLPLWTTMEKRTPNTQSNSTVSVVINTPPTKNAFSLMMERSATVFSTNKSRNNDHGNVIRHRFHLHNSEGHVTWNTQDNCDGENHDGDSNGTEIGTSISAGLSRDIHWSAIIMMKQVKRVNTRLGDNTSYDERHQQKALELTMVHPYHPPQSKESRI